MSPREILLRREREARRSLASGGRRLLDGADRRFGLSGRIRRRPWLALAAGALSGGLLGAVTARVRGFRILRSAARTLSAGAAFLLRAPD